MKKKFSVLIAEDEPEIARGLSEIINSHKDFQVVFCANDGEEAFNWMHEHSIPDVLITDIRMPGMNGLSLLQQIREENIEICPVIISGYGNFEYARQAIKYGVAEYLLKPVLPQDCLNMLDSLSNRLSRETKAVFNLNLALNHRNTMLPEHKNPLFLIAASLGNFPFAPGALHRDENMLREYMRGMEKYVAGEMYFGLRNGVHFWLGEISGGVYQAQSFFAALTEALRVRAEEEFHSMTLALSRPIQEQDDIFSAAGRLTAQMRQNALFGGNVIIDMNLSQKNQRRNAAFGTLFVVDDHLADSIRYRDYSAFHDLLKKKFDQWHQGAQPVSMLLDYVKFQYIYTAQQIFASSTVDALPIPYDWENRLYTIFTLSDSWNDLCDGVFGLFADQFNMLQTANAPRNIMRDVEEYIRKNYTERITNQSLARHFGFVPSYISSMFKKYKGVSPCDYLTQVRIENAQRIIRESDSVNFYEISYALGFSDSSYFSKLFKKIVGMTPSEYRAQFAKNGQE